MSDIYGWIHDNERLVPARSRAADGGRNHHRVGRPDRLGVGALLCRAGFDVIGIENDMRAQFFGQEASTTPTSEQLVEEVESFRWEQLDIRDADGVTGLFARHARQIELIVPRGAAVTRLGRLRSPDRLHGQRDGTLNLLQAARTHAPVRHVHLRLDQQGLT